MSVLLLALVALMGGLSWLHESRRVSGASNAPPPPASAEGTPVVSAAPPEQAPAAAVPPAVQQESRQGTIAELLRDLAVAGSQNLIWGTAGRGLDEHVELELTDISDSDAVRMLAAEISCHPIAEYDFLHLDRHARIHRRPEVPPVKGRAAVAGMTRVEVRELAAIDLSLAEVLARLAVAGGIEPPAVDPWFADHRLNLVIREPVSLANALLAVASEAHAELESDETGRLRFLPGPRVSLRLRDAPIGAYMRLMASDAGLNIVIPSPVAGSSDRVTAKFVDVAWQDALNALLRGFDGLVAVLDGGGKVIRITEAVKLARGSTLEDRLERARLTFLGHWLVTTAEERRDRSQLETQIFQLQLLEHRDAILELVGQAMQSRKAQRSTARIDYDPVSQVLIARALRVQLNWITELVDALSE